MGLFWYKKTPPFPRVVLLLIVLFSYKSEDYSDTEIETEEDYEKYKKKSEEVFELFHKLKLIIPSFFIEPRIIK